MPAPARPIFLAAIVLSLPAFAGCGSLRTTATRVAPPIAADAPELREPMDPAHYDPARLSAALFYATNRIRTDLQLPALAWLEPLDRAADLQASYSALNLTAVHENILPEFATSMDRVEHFGVHPAYAAENALLLPMLDVVPAHGVQDRLEGGGIRHFDASTGRRLAWHTYESFAAAALVAWMNSPGHRANIVNPALKCLGTAGRPARTPRGVDVLAAVQVFCNLDRPARP